jgi:hypothetical protein
MSVTAHYEGGSRTPRELQKIVTDLIESVDGDPELAADIRGRGFDPSALSVDAIQVRPAGAGLDPVTVTLIVSFLGLPARDIWKYVLLPRIRRRWGVDIIGRQLDSDVDDAADQ